MKQVWDEPRLVRSADMSLGAQARRTISLIVDVVPDDATILLPPIGEPRRYSLTRSMQYFFFPRTPIQCNSLETEACQRALGNTEVFILVTEDFPLPIATSPLSRRVYWNLDWRLRVYFMTSMFIICSRYKKPYCYNAFT